MTRRRSRRWLAYLSILSLLIGAAMAGAPMAMGSMAGAAQSVAGAAANTPASMAGPCAGGIDIPAPCCVGHCKYCAHFAGTMTAWAEQDAPPPPGCGTPDRREALQGAPLSPDPAPPRISFLA